MKRKLKVVTIGGGGGHAQVLKGLKHNSEIVITAICPSTDTGGSTGRLCTDYNAAGYLGDATKCMAALCPDEFLSAALLYRFKGGCLDSHSVKNVLMLGLEMAGTLDQALGAMYKICGLGEHRVIPVTTERTELYARVKVGNTIFGETNIDQLAKNPLWSPSYHSIEDVQLRPQTKASAEARNAVTAADVCVICPGDLYSSVIPVLLPDGMKSAFQHTHARIVVIVNIMTKRGETDNYDVFDFVVPVENQLGRACDVVVCNNEPIVEQCLVRYELEKKVQIDPLVTAQDPRIVEAPLVMVTEHGFLYHDPEKLSAVLREIFSAVPV